MLDLSKLPQSATIYRPTQITDEYGELGSGLDTMYSNINCRLVNSKNANSTTNYETGYTTKGLYLIFMNLVDTNGIDISLKLGDQISIDSNKYVIMFINEAPGGKENHHQQIDVDILTT